MSATNRGARGGGGSDYFPTPAWVTLRLLEHAVLPKARLWLEPSAGEGHIIRAANSARPDLLWAAYELRKECGPPLRATGAAVQIGDFLTANPDAGPTYDVALGNPPFSLAQEFVEQGLRCAYEVTYLLRLSFLESQKRQSFFRRVGVPDVFVLPERPSFTGEGTDSCAYAWMRWKRGRAQEGRVSILYDTRQASLFGATS
jgi:hypothetical protein